MFKHLAVLTTGAVTFWIGLCPSLAGDLVNSGFEDSAPATGLPSATEFWAGDYSAFVAAENNIIPSEGLRMLRFLHCGFSDRATSLNSAELFQLIDLSNEADLIANGSAVVDLSMLCNRVAGDTETDDAFAVVIYAFAGAPSSFPSQWPGQILEASAGTVFTDGDTATWESVATCLQLPLTTGFVALRVSASENIFNDSSGTEFDGHYADEVQFEIRCLGDITKDRIIDAADGVAFMETVSGSEVPIQPSDLPSDFDCDQDVDMFDLAEMQLRPAEGC